MEKRPRGAILHAAMSTAPPSARTPRAPQTGVSRYASHDGLEIVATSFGNPEAPPILFLHGGGQTRHAWEQTAIALARRGWRAVSLDLRGHGDTGWCPRGDYTISAYRDDLRAVIAAETRRAGPPVVVGASLGGLVTLLACGERIDADDARPVAARAVVLVDIAHTMERAGVRRVLDFMGAHADGFASLDEAARAVSEYLPHRRRPKDARGIEKNLRRRPDGRYRWHWDPRVLDAAEARQRDPAYPGRLESASRGLRCPVLLVRGQHSDVLSEDGVRSFLDAVPHAEYVDVSGATHMVVGDSNDRFSTAIADFLAAIDREAS